MSYYWTLGLALTAGLSALIAAVRWIAQERRVEGFRERIRSAAWVMALFASCGALLCYLDQRERALHQSRIAKGIVTIIGTALEAGKADIVVEVLNDYRFSGHSPEDIYRLKRELGDRIFHE